MPPSRGCCRGIRQNPEGAGTALSTLVRHPDLTKAFLGFNVYLLFRSSLPAPDPGGGDPAHRAPAPLRVQWQHHVEMAKAEGLTDADVEAVRRGEATNELDRLAIVAADELDETSNLTDETWKALGEHLSERQRMDLVFTVGAYGMLAMAFNTLVYSSKGKVRKCHFPKPAAGSWTESYPELGTAPVNYSDSIDPEHYAKEQEAIFKHSLAQRGPDGQAAEEGQLLHQGDRRRQGLDHPGSG